MAHGSRQQRQQGWYTIGTLRKQFPNLTVQIILSLSAVCLPNFCFSHKLSAHPSQSGAAGPVARGGVRADAGRPALERHAAAVDGRAPQLPRQLPLPHRGSVVVGAHWTCELTIVSHFALYTV